MGGDAILPRSAVRPFYARLNRILDSADFDGYVAGLCQRFYADEIGLETLAPQPSETWECGARVAFLSPCVVAP